MEMLLFSKAVNALSEGEVVVYPTDTLYGLGADIFNDSAVRKVFNLKNRPFNDPLSIAVSSIDEIEKIAFLDDRTRCIAEVFLPGRLTLVLKKKKIVSDIITGGFEKIAVRIPKNKIALKLLSDFGPITSTSANIHGKQTPTVINDIYMQFKDKVKVYLDDGLLEGKPSTIVDTTSEEIKVLRAGDISKKEIMEAITNG